jgi:hypothetical protein
MILPEKKQKVEKEVLGVEDEVGPPIDVMATLSANLRDERTLLNSIRQYVIDGIEINTLLRDAFIEQNNTMGVLKHQGSLDTLSDIRRILAGEQIATLAEMRAEMKKAKETQGQGYLG